MARTGFFSDDLFINLAEQVKLPFVQIMHEAEMLRANLEHSAVEQSSNTITLASRVALELIDGYLLSVQLEQQELQFEQVSLSSTMYDIAEDLQSYATAHSCKLELHIGGKYGPVMTHRQALRAALRSLTYNFIEAATAPHESSQPIITLAVRKNVAGVNAGIFTNNVLLSKNLFMRAKTLKGNGHQPMAKFDSGNATGVFVADALMAGIGSPLKVSRFRGQRGLAATMLASRQLLLV